MCQPIGMLLMLVNKEDCSRSCSCYILWSSLTNNWLLYIQFISLYVFWERLWNSSSCFAHNLLVQIASPERYFLQSCNDSHQTCLVKLLFWLQWREPKIKTKYHTGHVEGHHVGNGLVKLARPGISSRVMTRDHIRLFCLEVLILVLEIWKCKVTM